jgi:hypothetical protein
MKPCCAVDAVAVGEGDRGHVELRGALDEGFGLRRSGEEAEGAGGVEFDIGHERQMTDDRLQMTVMS